MLKRYTLVRVRAYVGKRERERMHGRERNSGSDAAEAVEVNNLSLRPFFRSSSVFLRADGSLFSRPGFFLLPRVSPSLGCVISSGTTRKNAPVNLCSLSHRSGVCLLPAAVLLPRPIPLPGSIAKAKRRKMLTREVHLVGKEKIKRVRAPG